MGTLYNKSHGSFEPLELAIEGKGTVIDHKFVTISLRTLYGSSTKTIRQFLTENHIFRDHIVLYATEVEELDGVDEDPEAWQSIFSYYELIKRHMGIINMSSHIQTFFP